MERSGGVGQWVVKPAVEALVVAALLALLGPWIVRQTSVVLPTCDDPRGLTPVDVAGLVLDGDAEVVSQPEPPLLDGRRSFDPRRAFDGRINGGWAVQVEAPDEISPEQALAKAREATAGRAAAIGTLAVRFTGPGATQDIRLACVINGQPLDPDSYRRADRARHVRIDLDCPDDAPRAVTLRSMPDDQFQTMQDLRVSCTAARGFVLEIRSTYPGQAIEDPATGERVEPSDRVAIAEVLLFRPARHGEDGWNPMSAGLAFVRGLHWAWPIGALVTAVILLGVTTRRMARRSGSPSLPQGAGTPEEHQAQSTSRPGRSTSCAAEDGTAALP
jgi:hypothetical protein